MLAQYLVPQHSTIELSKVMQKKDKRLKHFIGSQGYRKKRRKCPWQLDVSCQGVVNEGRGKKSTLYD